ncbi:hypothetical protein [Massilia sp. Root335]|uniref:hypothetical protein n=1 Tax=Massilia sp. Root335 TaxID=1736517 RepID=UPI000715735A|nr:hypothetical protein [Massilia sp. Root335]KQV49953.1 hypothetical protein ASC93_10505 [Massilia sp. Root335]
MASALASSTPALRGRLFFGAAVAALVVSMQPQCARADEHTNVATRFGPVETQAVPAAGAGLERSDIRLRGASLGQVDGNAGLVKLSVQDDADYVLVDAQLPDPQCRHRFTLLRIGPGDAAAMSQPFGDCLTGFGARRAGDNVVVQLAREGAAQVHEFVWMQDRMKELSNVLTRCEAAQLTAASRWIPVESAQAGRVVTGTGRAWFHTAPLDECKLPTLFVIPGDVLTVLHTYGDYADVAYRNPRTGRAAGGWVRLDHLADSAPKP